MIECVHSQNHVLSHLLAGFFHRVTPTASLNPVASLRSFLAKAMNEPITVICLNCTARLSGGEIALASILADLDREVVLPVVVLAEDRPLVERLVQLGIETRVVPLSSAMREVRKDALSLGAASRIKGLPHLISYAATIARLARRRGASLLRTNSLKADIYGALAG